MNKGAQNNFGQQKQYDSSAQILSGVDLVAKDIRAQYSRCSVKCFMSVRCDSALQWSLQIQYMFCFLKNILCMMLTMLFARYLTFNFDTPVLIPSS